MQLQTQNACKAELQGKLPDSLHIDMTPMVDLGFLLITFFIFTTTLTDKNSMSLTMPKAGKPIAVAESKTLSIVLSGENKIFVYEGMWDQAFLKNAVSIANYNEDGLRKLVRTKQKAWDQKNPGDSEDIIVLIKPMSESSYSNLVNVLDEMLINGIKKYAVVEPDQNEVKYALNH